MTRTTLFRALLSAAATLMVVANICSNFTGGALPFTPQWRDADTAIVKAMPAIPLPAGLQAGDEIDLKALDTDARSALLATGYRYSRMVTGITYQIVVRRDGSEVKVPVVSVPALRAEREWQFITGTSMYFQLVLLVVALLTLWLGQDRAARFLGLWALAYIIGSVSIEVPLSGMMLFYFYLISWVIYIFGRLALYIAAEALIGDALTASQRSFFRVAMGLSLIGSLVLTLYGGWLLVEQGSAAWLQSDLTWFVTVPYVIAALALMVAQRHALGAHRIRIQWMMWSLFPFTLGILARSIPAIGKVPGIMLNDLGLSIGITGTLYAILRYRVVDVRVVLDRTLVYGAVTALVVGIVAAMNSLALKLALPPGAGWLLQVIVPLSLGITLGRVRRVLDQVVEQVFFRRKYLAEKALETFAGHAGHIQDAPKLLDATAREIMRHLGTPAVAIYSAETDGYRRMKQAGGTRFPELLDADDPALVAIRAEQKAVDITPFESTLGDDCCLFPMMVLGKLRGVIVCRNRPHERYGSDERKLLSQVASDVGAAWRILRARDNEELVVALATGTMPQKKLKEKAKALTLAWEG